MCKIISVIVAGGALKCQSNMIVQNNNLQAKNKCRGGNQIRKKIKENHLFSLLILDAYWAIRQFDLISLSSEIETPCNSQKENKEEKLNAYSVPSI